MSSSGSPRLPRSRIIANTCSAFLITSTFLSELLRSPGPLRHVQGYCFPCADYYGSSVAIFLAEGRRSRVPSPLYVSSATQVPYSSPCTCPVDSHPCCASCHHPP